VCLCLCPRLLEYATYTELVWWYDGTINRETLGIGSSMNYYYLSRGLRYGPIVEMTRKGLLIGSLDIFRPTGDRRFIPTDYSPYAWLKFQ
jgi:hypothetical protein